jgi:EmrB/QacA subfamily drug resistance transporter
MQINVSRFLIAEFCSHKLKDMETTIHPPLTHAEGIRTKLTIFGICMILFMVNLDASIVVVGLPTMIKTLQSTFATAQWIILSYMLSLTTLIAGAGRLGDLFGKKQLYIAGIAVFTVASLCCALSPNAASLIIFRAIQGMGAAFCISLSFAIAGDMVPKEQMGKTMGILTTMVPLGIASGPTVGGLLISIWGWPSMFLVNIPIGIIAFIVISKFAHSVKPNITVKVDIVGMLLLSLVLCSYALGMTYMEKSGIGSPLVSSLLAVSVILLILFVSYEKRIKHPFLHIGLFKNSVLSASLFASALVYVVMTSTIILFPFYLSKACGFKPLQVGLIMSFGPLVTALLSIVAGRVADKYNSRKVMLYGVLVMAIGCFFMSMVNPAQGVLGFLWRIGIIQLGLTFFQTPNNATIMKLASPQQRGLLSGLLSLSRSIGQITGTVVMGAIFAIAVSSFNNADKINNGSLAVTSGIDLVFKIAAILAVLAALLIYIAIKKTQTENGNV